MAVSSRLTICIQMVLGVLCTGPESDNISLRPDIKSRRYNRSLDILGTDSKLIRDLSAMLSSMSPCTSQTAHNVQIGGRMSARPPPPIHQTAPCASQVRMHAL